jgi:hypothetical protein
MQQGSQKESLCFSMEVRHDDGGGEREIIRERTRAFGEGGTSKFMPPIKHMVAESRDELWQLRVLSVSRSAPIGTRKWHWFSRVGGERTVVIETADGDVN